MSGPPAVRFSRCAPQLASGQRLGWGNDGLSCGPAYCVVSSTTMEKLGIPGAVPRRGTDSQTTRLFQREESSWEADQSQRRGWGVAGIIPVLGCNPIRKEPRSLACLSRVGGVPRNKKKQGLIKLLFCGERGEGEGSLVLMTVLAHGTRAIRSTGEFTYDERSSVLMWISPWPFLKLARGPHTVRSLSLPSSLSGRRSHRGMEAGWRRDGL